MMTTRRVRIRWSRPLVLAVAVYVGAGMAMSAWHWWQLHQQARQLQAEIAVVNRSNHLLQADLTALHSPVTLRQMLLGKVPLPNPLWPTTEKW